MMDPVAFDVNVLISSVIGPLGHARQLWLRWQAEQFSLIVSEHIIRTTIDRLLLPRLSRRYQIDPFRVAALESVLRMNGRMVTVPSHEVQPITGDPEDDAVLATVRLGRAGFLVTGDQGLLALTEYAGARILTPRAFLALFDADTN